MTGALAVIARVSRQTIAFDAAAVEAVVDLGALTPVPLAPAHIVGLAAARSQVMTVVDVGASLGLKKEAPSAKRAIVMLVGGQRYALRVDAVLDVETPRGADFSAAGAGPAWSAAACGTVDTDFGLALVLDPAVLIAGSAQITTDDVNRLDTGAA